MDARPMIHRVSVVNPACIKGFVHSENIRNKNAAIDAALIAATAFAWRRRCGAHRHWNHLITVKAIG